MEKSIGLYMAVIIGMSLLLIGCTSTTMENVNENSDVEDDEIYTYLEEKIKLPENTSKILDICYKGDGTIRIVTTNEQVNDTKIWDTKDAGDSWEQVKNIKTELNLTDGAYCNAFVSSAGDIFCVIADDMVNNSDMLYSNMKYYIIKDNGIVTELFIELTKSVDVEKLEHFGIPLDDGAVIKNSINTCSFSRDDHLLVTDYLGSGYMIDQNTGEILVNYDIENGMEWVEGLGTFNDTLIAASYEGTLFYDLATGEPILSSVLEDDIMLAVMDSLDSTANVNSMLQLSYDGSKLYYCNTAGLYQYAGDGLLSCILESSGTSMDKSDLYTKDMAVVDEEMFYLTIQELESATDSLYRYTRTLKENVKDSEITVWALKDSNDIRQAVSIYQAEHSNVVVNIEIGMTGEDAVTVSDAIRKLNTELSAGEGPDVIFLDQLPLDIYMEKGILADLSDVVELAKEQDGVFENIVNTYRVDEKVKAIPSRFAIMSIEGNKEAVEASHNLEKLLEYAQQLRINNPDKSVFAEYDFNDIVKFFYYATSSFWMKDNELNKSGLTDFCVQIKQIYELNLNSPDVSLINDDTDLFMSVYYYQLASGNIQIATDYINAAGYQLSGIQAVMDVFPDVTYGLINSDAGKLYIPTAIVGVNSQSTEMDIAKEFVTCVLLSEAQSKDTGSGNPINRKAMENSFMLDEEYTITAGAETLQLRALTAEKKVEFIELVESLDTPVNVDGVVLEAVFNQLEKYILDEVSVEEAVEKMAREIELYLIE